MWRHKDRIVFGGGAVRQSFVVYMGRKLPGKNPETIAVEVGLACESETMSTVDQMEFMSSLLRKVHELVVAEFGGEELPPPRPSEQ